MRKSRSRVDILYQRAVSIMQRDVAAIAALSLGGKLEDAPARHLTNYVKLLRELKAQEDASNREAKDKAKQAAKALTDAEVEAIVKA